jgi:DNA-binding NtrC family response regulator
VPIHLPPLRGRPADIPALAAVFVERAAARMGRHVDAIEPASLDRLCAFHWPGNIRQLQNVIERSVIAGAGPELSVPESMLTGAGVASVPAFDDRLTPFDDGLTLEDVKRRYVRHVLAVTRGNMSRAAAILAIDRRSLYRIVERYGLTVRSPFPCPCPTAKESTS